jgi:hypothetical protein
MKKIIDTVVMLFLAIVLPLLWKPHLLFTWPIWLVAMSGIFISLSQPTFHLERESIDVHDRSSLRLILVAVLLCFIVPIFDYGYGQPRTIEMTQTSSLLGLGMIVGGLWFRYWSIQVLGRFFYNQSTNSVRS